MRTPQLLGVVVAVLMLALVPLASAAGEVNVMALWLVDGKADGTITTLTTEVGKSVQFAVVSDGLEDYNLYVDVYDSKGAVVATPYAHLYLLNQLYDQFYEIVSYTPEKAEDYTIVASVLSANGNAQDMLYLKTNPVEVFGCTNPKAVNYNPKATKDDGSCTYDVTCVPGTTEKLTFCWDGSIKDYRVCNADGTKWDDFSNVCLVPNAAPVMNPIAPQNFYESIPGTFIVSAKDAENSPLTYEMKSTGQISGMQLDAETGKVTFTPDYDFVLHPLTQEKFYVSFRAYDGKWYSNWVSAALIVNDRNRIPYAVSNDYNVMAGVPMEVTLRGFDHDTEDAASLKYYINDSPLHGKIPIITSNHKVIYTADSDYKGMDQFSYYVVDQMGAKSYLRIISFRVSAAPDVLGCTDPKASNYNPAATKDDGSCTYDVNCVPGTTENLTRCWDGSIKNYRVCNADGHSWNVFSNTCPPQLILGCTDPKASNYNPAATKDDGSCTYDVNCVPGTTENLTRCWDGSIKGYRVCNADGHSWNVFSNVCPVQPVLGCTDPKANNYNPAATKDDGSCRYNGCAPGEVKNVSYCRDGSVKEYLICNADGKGWILRTNTCPTTPVLGCTDILALNYNPFANKDDGSCLYAMGCTDPSALNYNPQAVKDDGSCIYEILGCTDPKANNYNPAATKDDGSCTYDVNCVPGTTENLTRCWDGSIKNYRVCNADGHSWIVFNNVCPVQPVLGCTDPKANNYNPAATKDDGSCTYYVLGCTDINALNYDSAAEKDDGSCRYSDFSITSAPPTIGTIGVEYSYQVNVGGEHKTLTYSLAQAPQGMSISQNGLVLWVPEREGHYTVGISVTDGVRTATQKYTIYVRNLYASLQVVKAQFTPELVSIGDQTQFTVKVENAGDGALQDLRVMVMIYDLGIRTSSGEFNLKPGQGKTITNFIEIPGEASPGEYLVEVYIGNDQIHEVAYRQLVVG